MVPLKNRKKKWAHFSKMDIFKMSVFQNAIIKFYKKMKNPFLLVDDLNTKKIIKKLLPYFFIILFEKDLEDFFC